AEDSKGLAAAIALVPLGSRGDVVEWAGAAHHGLLRRRLDGDERNWRPPTRDIDGDRVSRAHLGCIRFSLALGVRRLRDTWSDCVLWTAGGRDVRTHTATGWACRIHPRGRNAWDHHDGECVDAHSAISKEARRRRKTRRTA